eukprot:328108-Chlamydomonas_euryale.AAC.1
MRVDPHPTLCTHPKSPMLRLLTQLPVPPRAPRLPGGGRAGRGRTQKCGHGAVRRRVGRAFAAARDGRCGF